MKPRRARWRGPLVPVWYNIGDGPDHDKKADLSRFAKHGAHLIFLAECSDRVTMLREWCAAHGWTYWPGDGSPGAAATPVLIRNDVLPCIKERATVEAIDSEHVGDPGAGPERVKRKVFNTITVRRATKRGLPRRSVRFIPGHWIPSATRNLPNKEKRRELHRDQTDAALAQKGGRRVITLIVGDLNCEWDNDLMDPFRKDGFHNIPTGPTHDRRTIDMWLVNLKRWSKRVRRAFTVKGSSDHHAVVIEID